MVDKKKENPKKGEFIDLDKSDFKKKTGITKIFFKYLIIFIVFFSLGFFTYQPLKENFYHKFKEPEIIEQKVVKIDQEKLKNEYLFKLGEIENNFSEKLNFYEERINNLESKNKKLSAQLDSVSQSFENFKEFNPNDSHLLDYKKNKVLINFLIFQENFNNRKDFGNEIEILQNLFTRDYETNNLLIFFKTLDIQNLKTKENLIQKINKDLSVYDNDMNDLFIKLIENLNVKFLKNKFIHQSKIEIKNYLLDLNSREISLNNTRLKLTEKEINTIIYLSNKKIPISIQELQTKVWGYQSGMETHTVETHIYRLRKKILKSFNDENLLLSKKNGYQIS